MGDGYQVDPETLRTTARQVYDGSDSISAAAALFALTGLAPDALGDVPAASEFSKALDAFVHRHGTDLQHGSVWVNAAGDGVMDAASDYERNEDTAAASFTNIGGRR